MAKKDEIHFPGPLVVTMPSERPPEEKPVETTSVHNNYLHTVNEQYETNKILFANIRNQCCKEGFDISAVVSRRLRGGIKPAMNPRNWGIVVRMNIYEKLAENYRPLVIKWFSNNGKEANESAHALDELFLVHSAISDTDLEIMFMVQDEELQDDVAEATVIIGENYS